MVWEASKEEEEEGSSEDACEEEVGCDEEGCDDEGCEEEGSSELTDVSLHPARNARANSEPNTAICFLFMCVFNTSINRYTKSLVLTFFAING